MQGRPRGTLRTRPSHPGRELTPGTAPDSNWIGERGSGSISVRRNTLRSTSEQPRRSLRAVVGFEAPVSVKQFITGCDLSIPVAAQQESLGGVLATLTASVQNLQHILAAHIESCYEHSKRMETKY